MECGSSQDLKPPSMARGPATSLASDRRLEEHRPAFSKRFRAKDGRGEEEISPASLLSPLFQQFHQLQHPPTPTTRIWLYHSSLRPVTLLFNLIPAHGTCTWTVWSQHLATIEIQSLEEQWCLGRTVRLLPSNSEAAKTCPRSQRWWKRFSQDAWPHFQRSAKAKARITLT